MANTTSESDLQALERFIVDNDDLLTLEEAIGRFNIFDALGIARAEIRHSNFLAWLLDPAESHGQGDLFLRSVLLDILKHAPVSRRPCSPLDLDGVELGSVEIRREWRSIDLLIVSQTPPFAVAIENKVDSGEHSDQLARYRAVVGEEFPHFPSGFVYLTPDGRTPTDDRWITWSYGDLHRVLARVRRTNERSIGPDVLTFLDHYLSLIGSAFMDDPAIAELCARIAKNHRRALDLIWQHQG